MREWLYTRGRATLSLLSDVGGALALVALAVGLLTAAGVGALLVEVVDVFPQPYLSFLVAGFALLAAGLTLHLLRDRLGHHVEPHPALPAAGPDPSAETNVERLARELREGHHQSNEAEIRRSLRQIREELRDNRLHVVRARAGELGRIRQISFSRWFHEEDVLLGLRDPDPHTAARHAYRELEGIYEVFSYRSSSTTWTLRKQPGELLETDVETTLEAIDEAIEKLNAAETV